MREHIESMVEKYQSGILLKKTFVEMTEAIIAGTDSLNTLGLIKELIIEAGVLDDLGLENLDDAIFNRVAPLIQTEY